MRYMAGETTYSVGTLCYNRAGLAKLFFWLLLGDFCWKIMETALPTLLPLQLRGLGHDAAAIAWVLSLANLAALLFSPFIGVYSDRLRSRFGRRRPFLLVSTPIMAGGLFLIPHVKVYWQLCAVVLIVQTANILQTVLFYLYADVVPGVLIGRFLAAFRIVSALGELAFQWYLLPRFETQPVFVWTFSGGIYLLFFLLMLHFVKEGTYEAPEKMSWKELSVKYVKDGLGTRYIWWLWLTLGMTALGGASWSFVILYAKEELHLSLGTIGHYLAYGTMAVIVFAWPAGWLIDRFGAKLVWGVSVTALGIVHLLAYGFVHNDQTMILFFIFHFGINAFLGTALLPMLYSHIPQNRFGEVVSAQSFVVQSFMFLSTNAIGQLIVWLGQGYKISFAYSGFFFVLTPIFLFLLMRASSPWKHSTNEGEKLAGET
jgi:maltose/moltooligosaccharide transporter